MDIELLRANLVRTLVPLVVGALVSMLPFLAGNEGVSTLIGFAVSAAYYAFFRIAETRYPWLGVFLGKKMAHGAPLTARAPLSSASSAAAHTPGSTALEDLAEVILAGPGEPPGVVVGGQPLPGVEAVRWTARAGEPTLLTIELRGVPMQMSSAHRST